MHAWPPSSLFKFGQYLEEENKAEEREENTMTLFNVGSMPCAKWAT